MAASKSLTSRSALLLVLVILGLAGASASHASVQLDSWRASDLLPEVDLDAVSVLPQVDSEVASSGLPHVDSSVSSEWWWGAHAGHHKWYGSLPFCGGRVWVVVKPTEKGKKATCPAGAVKANTSCGAFTSCTFISQWGHGGHGKGLLEHDEVAVQSWSNKHRHYPNHGRHGPTPAPHHHHHYAPAPSPGHHHHHHPIPHHAPAPTPAHHHKAPAPSPSHQHKASAPSPVYHHKAPVPSPAHHKAPAPSPVYHHTAPAPSPAHHKAPAPSPSHHHKAPAPAPGHHHHHHHHHAPSPSHRLWHYKVLSEQVSSDREEVVSSQEVSGVEAVSSEQVSSEGVSREEVVSSQEVSGVEVVSSEGLWSKGVSSEKLWGEEVLPRNSHHEHNQHGHNQPWKPNPHHAPVGAPGPHAPPAKTCKTKWNVKGNEIELSEYPKDAKVMEPSGYTGPGWDRPCKWLPNNEGTRVLVCVKCAAEHPSKKPPVAKTTESGGVSAASSVAS